MIEIWKQCWGVPHMLLVLSITFHFHWYIWVSMCSTGPFQFRWLRGYIHSSCYYHHQIGSIILTHYHIFPWLCAWDVCCIIFCHLLRIHSGKTVILFSLLLCRLWWVQIFGCVLACRSCSFVCTLHHLIISIVQTYLRTLNLWNACQIYFVECVSKIKHIFQSSIIQYMGLCIFSLPISVVMIERIYTLSYYHHQIGSMNYYPLFRVRSWNNGMSCMSLYILMNSWYGQIASWDIRVLVVFAPNLALCHRHAALLPC